MDSILEGIGWFLKATKMMVIFYSFIVILMKLANVIPFSWSRTLMPISVYVALCFLYLATTVLYERHLINMVDK